MSAFTCVGASLSSSAMNELKREVSSMVPKPYTCCHGSPSRCTASCVRMSTGFEARCIRLAAQAGGDEENVAVRGASVVARVNLLVAAERAAVQQVERLALGQVLVRIENLQLGHQAAALQRKRRAGTHAATAANDCDFHNFKFFFATD